MISELIVQPILSDAEILDKPIDHPSRLRSRSISDSPQPKPVQTNLRQRHHVWDDRQDHEDSYLTWLVVAMILALFVPTVTMLLYTILNPGTFHYDLAVNQESPAWYPSK